MAPALEQSLAAERARWDAAGLRRTLDEDPGSTPGLVDFTSNDYLGLARAPELVDAAQRAVAEHGVGGRASRLLGGGSRAHVEAEAAVADWLGAPAALLFASGYQANLSLVGALADRQDALFSDARNHASLIDAARLSRARVYVHRHLDLDELGAQLARAKHARRRIVLTEGVFSMDGDAAPLAELAALCRAHDAWLIVDEAHSVGLLGPQGAGAWAGLDERAALEDEGLCAARIVTGGKSLGVSGAFVVGSRALREHLIQRARGFVFSTAPSPAIAGALHAAIACARAADEARARVLEGARTLARALDAPAPAAAIVPFVVGSSEAALELAQGVRGHGFDVRAVRWPTVAEGTARLRLVHHATNTPAELEELTRLLREAPRAETPQRSKQQPPARTPLFVVGTDTGIGKTVTSALLLRAATRATEGRAAYWKPVQTGDDSDTETVRQLANAKPHEMLRPAWHLALPASPHEAAAAEDKRIRPQDIASGLDGLQRTMPETQLVVELAGGLLVPYLADAEDLYTQADWLAHARPRTILVARSALGTLNHTLLTLEALRARHLEPEALFLVGDAHPANHETLATVGGVPRVFEVPFFAALDTATLDGWLAQHDLSFLFS